MNVPLGWALLVVALMLGATTLLLVQQSRNSAKATKEQTIPPGFVESEGTFVASGTVYSVDSVRGLLILNLGFGASMGWPTPIIVGLRAHSDLETLARLELDQRVTVTYRKRAADLELIEVRTAQ